MPVIARRQRRPSSSAAYRHPPDRDNGADEDLARPARRGDSGGEPAAAGLAASPFRVDRDRIAASPFFARLGGVTQVVSPTGSGLLLHNRLTHSLKVAQLARAIAERLAKSDGETVDRRGGCDPDVVEAAALAHDHAAGLLSRG